MEIRLYYCDIFMFQESFFVFDVNRGGCGFCFFSFLFILFMQFYWNENLMQIWNFMDKYQYLIVFIKMIQVNNSKEKGFVKCLKYIKIKIRVCCFFIGLK